MTTPLMPQVKNIVFLMLENRSLDNLLGWLYPQPPANVYPPGSAAAYDGLIPGRFSNPARTWNGGVETYPVVQVPGGLGSDQDRVPAYDPYEEMKTAGTWNGVLNQLFGNQDIIPGLPQSPAIPAMQGFLQDYYASYMFDWKGLDSLWTYTPEQLPVINGLARSFAVSDRWFCSVPTQTNPNRAYSICGTSLGRENNLQITAIEQFNVPTVFNYLAQAGKSWGLYYADIWVQGQCYTQYTFPQISQATGDSEIAGLDTFFQRAAAGTLPQFSYLEPKWGYGKGAIFVQGTDYHPPTHVDPGETFLAQVAQAVRNGPQWNETLLVVTFDEHGGTYDHVGPPWGAINPDGLIGADGFRFDLFGARVPTLLVSPFVPASTVFRAPAGSAYPFDHTSFIKTLLGWAGVDASTVNLGARMPQAPTFDGVLQPTAVNASTVPPPPAPAAPKSSADATAAGLATLFAGVSAGAVRAILSTTHVGSLHAEVAKYRADPRQYEAGLV